MNQTPSGPQKAAIRIKAGLDWDKLKLAEDYSESFTVSSSVLVIRHGWVAGEWGSRSAYPVASVSKSLAALAMAKLFVLSASRSLAAGFGPENFVYPFLPSSWAGADARRKNIKIKHLMTMSSGLEPDDNPNQQNYLNVILNKPVRVAPQVEWSYASLSVDLLSIAAQTMARRTVRDVFNQQIAAPLGIPAVAWTSFNGYSKASSGASIAPRDLARIGYLMLMNGAWDSGSGQHQVVSSQNVALLRQWPSFLQSATFRATPGSPFPVDASSPQFFGLLWWTNRTGTGLGSAVPRDAYYARGYRETLLAVVPSLDLIVVRYGPKPLALAQFRSQFMARIMAAVLNQQS